MPDKDPGQARTPDPNETAAQQAAARQKTLQDERERVSNITAIGRKFKLVEEADKAIEEGTSTEAFNRMALDRIDNTNHSPSNVQPARPEHTNRVIAMPRYAKLRAFTGEQAEERAYRSGMWLLAQLWGNEKAQRWCNENGLEVRALTTGITSLGGALVPDVLSNAIIDLREDFGVFRRECRVIPMSTDTLIVPRRTGGLTAYFVGDNDEITASDKSWDQVQLVAKKLGALSLYSSELAEDAVISLADDLARELAYAFASKEDDCGFNGDGTSTFGGMQGVVTKLTVEALAGAVTAATNNDTFAELDASDLASVMAALPQYAHANAKWYCSLACFELVFSRLMAAAGGNTVDLLTGKVRPMYLGYPVVITQKMATSAGDLSELVMLMFGDLRLAAMMGARREIRVMVSEERYFEKDQIGIRATERFDIVVHDIGDNTNAGPIVSLIGD